MNNMFVGLLSPTFFSSIQGETGPNGPNGAPGARGTPVSTCVSKAHMYPPQYPVVSY